MIWLYEHTLLPAHGPAVGRRVICNSRYVQDCLRPRVRRQVDRHPARRRCIGVHPGGGGRSRGRSCSCRNWTPAWSSRVSTSSSEPPGGWWTRASTPPSRWSGPARWCRATSGWPQTSGSGADRVRFSGYLAGPDLVEAYRRSSVAALPSGNESFGMSLAEAMACGLPVVASRTGGIPDVVDDGRTGLLVTHGAVDEFAGALRRVIEDPALAERSGTGRPAQGGDGVRLAHAGPGHPRGVRDRCWGRPRLGRRWPSSRPATRRRSAASSGTAPRSPRGWPDRTSSIPVVVAPGGGSAPATNTTTVCSSSGSGRGPSCGTPRSARCGRSRSDGCSAPGTWPWSMSTRRSPGWPTRSAAVSGDRPVVLTYHAGSMRRAPAGRHRRSGPTSGSCSPGGGKGRSGRRRLARHPAVGSPGRRAGAAGGRPRCLPLRRAASSRRPAPVRGPDRRERHLEGRAGPVRGAGRGGRHHSPTSSSRSSGTGTAATGGRRRWRIRGWPTGCASPACWGGRHWRTAYHRASIVVLPSITEAESFGMCLIEAMACGRPVIGSRIGGIPFVVGRRRRRSPGPPGRRRRTGVGHRRAGRRPGAAGGHGPAGPAEGGVHDFRSRGSRGPTRSCSRSYCTSLMDRWPTGLRRDPPAPRAPAVAQVTSRYPPGPRAAWNVSSRSCPMRWPTSSDLRST